MTYCRWVCVGKTTHELGWTMQVYIKGCTWSGLANTTVYRLSIMCGQDASMCGHGLSLDTVMQPEHAGWADLDWDAAWAQAAHTLSEMEGVAMKGGYVYGGWLCLWRVWLCLWRVWLCLWRVWLCLWRVWLCQTSLSMCGWCCNFFLHVLPGSPMPHLPLWHTFTVQPPLIF